MDEIKKLIEEVDQANNALGKLWVRLYQMRDTEALSDWRTPLCNARDSVNAAQVDLYDAVDFLKEELMKDVRTEHAQDN